MSATWTLQCSPITTSDVASSDIALVPFNSPFIGENGPIVSPFAEIQKPQKSHLSKEVAPIASAQIADACAISITSPITNQNFATQSIFNKLVKDPQPQPQPQSPHQPQNSTTPTPAFPFFRLPPEIQSLILTHALLPSSPSTLSLLLTNRSIHYLARHLPFTAPTFIFPHHYHPYSSSLFPCLRFLRRLQPWQSAAIRHLSLSVTEADLAGFGMSGRGWLEVCAVLGRGLRTLRVEVRLGFMGGFVEAATVGGGLWRGDAEWVSKGLVLLRGLRKLEVEVNGVGVPGKSVLGGFEGELRRCIGRCGEVSVRGLVRHEMR